MFPSEILHCWSYNNVICLQHITLLLQSLAQRKREAASHPLMKVFKHNRSSQLMSYCNIRIYTHNYKNIKLSQISACTVIQCNGAIQASASVTVPVFISGLLNNARVWQTGLYSWYFLMVKPGLMAWFISYFPLLRPLSRVCSAPWFAVSKRDFLTLISSSFFNMCLLRSCSLNYFAAPGIYNDCTRLMGLTLIPRRSNYSHVQVTVFFLLQYLVQEMVAINKEYLRGSV